MTSLKLVARYSAATTNTHAIADSNPSSKPITVSQTPIRIPLAPTLNVISFAQTMPSHLRTSSRELEATAGAAVHNLDEEHS